MITAQDLEQAIAECQGQRNPTSSTCIKLAAFYIIRKELFGEEKEAEPFRGYSFMPEPSTIQIDSDSEFAGLINGRLQSDVLPVMDELMETIKIIQPRLYNAVIEKLS